LYGSGPKKPSICPWVVSRVAHLAGGENDLVDRLLLLLRRARRLRRFRV